MISTKSGLLIAMLLVWATPSAEAQNCPAAAPTAAASTGVCAPPIKPPIKHSPPVAQGAINVSCQAPLMPAPAQQVVLNVTPTAGKKSECESSPWLEFFAKVTWPIVILLLALAFGPALLRWLSAHRLKKAKIGDFEVEFTPRSAEKIRDSVGAILSDYRTVADQAYTQQASHQYLSDELKRAMALVESKIGRQLPPDVRATVHVPDVLYEGFLYQILNYLPTGGGGGRRFSGRRGILGQTWRMEQSRGTGNALKEGLSTPDESPSEALVREWGMTRAEATHFWRGSPRPAFICVLLRAPASEQRVQMGEMVGVFYMDSGTVNAFGVDSEANILSSDLERFPQIQALAAAVARTMSILRQSAIRIPIDNE